jgi:MoaA/NifB/PqqE/SkfB family radical SAM enzyme/GT2 family glycosyltransferase
VFCSRETLRGQGEDMDFGLFDALVSALDRPEIIRLNYSGESGNYPRLIDAIARAKSSSAQVELVTSLVSTPLEVVDRLPASGLDRLSISLHTLQPGRFSAIYGGGTWHAFETRLDRLVAGCRLLPDRAPVIDLAMVAMHSNVGEIAGIAAFGERLGLPVLSIHPVIQRAGVPYHAHCEVRPDGHLTDDFRTAIETNVKTAASDSRLVQISIARPERSSREPSNASGFHCDQNPFETAHILSNGDVVVCEVLDRTTMGNLRDSGFASVWNGAAYERFRQSYMEDRVEECRSCVFRTPADSVGALRTLWGWHGRDREGTLWSRTDSGFSCEGNGRGFVAIEGALPPAYRAEDRNSLNVRQDGRTVASAVNATRHLRHFRISLPLRTEGVTEFVASVQHPFSPWRTGRSQDTRSLGFTLFSAEISDTPQPPQRGRRFVLPRMPDAKCRAAGLVVGLIMCLKSRLRNDEPAPPRVPSPPAPTLSVLIPERGNPAMLQECLEALHCAIARLSDGVPVVVIVNGVSRRKDYASLENRYPLCKFVFIRRPLGFSAAIRKGLGCVSTGWTYLLNSDVLLSPEALLNVLQFRAPDVFSIASRVKMTGTGDGWETNRTQIGMLDGLVNLTELNPPPEPGPVEHAYSGGGSSLFQTGLLRGLIDDTQWYDPFYWEDADWGVQAGRMGFRNLFATTSSVLHQGKATVARYYDAGEISRIFERNRIQFQLRCSPDTELEPVRDRIANAPWQTIFELLHPGRVVSMARARRRSSRDLHT